MPRPLNSTDNFETIKNWLEETLSDRNPITPHENDIPNVLSIGINFWFMKLEGYQNLNNKNKLEAFEPKFSKNIDNEQWYLVYLGNESKENLNRHIYQNHDKDSLKTLSILRKKIGALLSDDLITPDTENLVNTFMKNYMKVFWITDFEGSNDLKIKQDVEKLTSLFKPLFVSLNNTDASALEINSKAKNVMNATILRINGLTNQYLDKKFKEDGEKIANWIRENRSLCTTKTISLMKNEVNEKMGSLIVQKLEIPELRVIIFKLFETSPDQLDEDSNKNTVWMKRKMKGWRYSGSKDIQYLPGYFSNTDNNNGPKHIIIRKEMDKKKLVKIWIKFYYVID